MLVLVTFAAVCITASSVVHQYCPVSPVPYCVNGIWCDPKKDVLYAKGEKEH